VIRTVYLSIHSTCKHGGLKRSPNKNFSNCILLNIPNHISDLGWQKFASL